jgi:hypothetical protein
MTIVMAGAPELKGCEKIKNPPQRRKGEKKSQS